MNAKLLLLAATSLLLGACSVTVSPGTTRATVAPAGVLISSFTPDRGTGSTYYVGENVSFRFSANRPGYLTLVSLDPDGFSNVLVSNAYVSAGTTVFPTRAQGVNFTVQPPRGMQRVRAIFTTTQQSSNVVLSGRYDSRGWENVTTVYVNPYPVNARDVRETYFYIR
ncbi:hypothetical protein HNR42_003416 [Deinobacterium chartae]|uniref:DUF4384 domain-containing protein n=1 Tax=Deinobacterium chartae TaxID=521158 RepID=A0A841I4K4_9DEIO|nr:DUF4384 domain-containing protein [Deinobacterium chartae]MBB6099956.1 hypothetical protein [Deinobacterium chartae]